MNEWRFSKGLLIGRGGYDLKDAHDRECLVRLLNSMEEEIKRHRTENRNLQYVKEGLSILETAINNVKELKDDYE